MKTNRIVTLVAVLGTYSFAQSASAADVERGKALFAERCVTCHGETGLGDGPVGMALPADQKPRNLQEGKFKVVHDDAKFKELLKGGGTALGLSPLMPPQPDLADADLESVIAFVRSLEKKS